MVESVGTVASNEICDSHHSGKNKPPRTPRDRKIDLAEVVRIERRIIIGMTICSYKRRVALKGRKTQAEIVSKTVGDPARAEHTKFVGKLAMNRVDVVVEVYSGEAAESCVA